MHVCHIIMHLFYCRDELNVNGSGIVSQQDSRASGFVSFSLSPFKVVNLLDGDAFPGFAAHQLQLYNTTTNQRIRDTDGNELLYLPFIDFDCLAEAGVIDPSQFNLVTVPDPRPEYLRPRQGSTISTLLHALVVHYHFPYCFML